MTRELRVWFIVCRGMQDIWEASPFHLTPVDPFEPMWSVLLQLKKTLYLLSLVVSWKAKYMVRLGVFQRM